MCGVLSNPSVQACFAHASLDAMAGALVHLAPVHLDGEIDGSSINAWKPGSTVCVLRWSVYDLLRGLLYDLDKAHGRLHDRIAGF